MKKLQVIFGYWLMFSVIQLFFYFLPQIIIFIICLISFIFVRILPHPDSHSNPFAFDSQWRFRH